MRKLLALMLMLALMCPAALAEAPAEIDMSGAADLPPITPLPMDLSPGYVPNPDGFIAADEEAGVLAGYQDASLTVTMERVTVGDSTFNVARIKIADPSQLRTGLENERASRNNKVSAIAAKHNAVVAIGGDFFADAKNGYIVRMYKEFRKSPKAVYDMLLIDQNGDFHIVLQSDAEELKALMQSGLTFPNIFNFGPGLIKDGQLLPSPEYYVKNGNRYNIRSTSEPRCAIGQVAPLEYIFVVVDGRRKDSDGCSTDELAQWLLEQGCVQAYNLDGGNSALMWFGGENYSDKTVKNERTVSDIIYISTAVDLGLEPEED